MNGAKHSIAIASKTITGQYESSTVLQQVNDQPDHQCTFRGVYTALCGVAEQ